MREISDPNNLANVGRIYINDVSAISELMYLDDQGSETQITSGGSLAGASVHWGDDIDATWGNTAASPDATITWETVDADANYLNLAISSASRNFIISEDRNIDWTHAAQTNPTLWIQSADSGTVADYISLAHDQTNAQIGIGAGDLILTIAGGNIVPSADDAWALGVSGTAISDLFLASGAVINFAAGDVTLTHASDTLTVGGATLIDVAAGIFELNDHVRFDTGVAMVASSYSVGRDADGTNQLHLNVPTGATFELSINDAAEFTLSSTAANFQNNSITTTGGGSLTGTWSDLGIVTTVDINGGTLDGVTIGGASAAAATFTTIAGSTGGNVLTITNSADSASVQVGILQGDRATMADGDEAYITLRLSNDGGTQTEFARITWVATDVNAGTSVDGRIDFAVVTAGTLADEMQLDGLTLSPSTSDGLALGTTSLFWGDLFLASGAVINFNSDVTLTHALDTLTIAGATLIDIAAGIFELNDAVRFDTGVAIVATSYSIGRDADGTNQLHLNVPTGSSFEFSVNDVAEVVLNATNLQPGANDGSALGVSGTAWADLFLASGGVINWSAADVTITHAADTLTFAGASTGYVFDAELTISTSGGTAQDAVDINYANTAYTTAVGLIDIVRTGALTGVDTQTIIDLQILPSFTLTEPGAGSVTLYGANIDLSGIAVTAGAGTSTLAALRLVANADADVGTNLALLVDAGTARFDGRVLENQGADVASANDLTLGADGNSFEITGTTQVNAITTSGWQNGSIITLLFTSTPTVKHNTAGGAGTAVLLLAGAVDFAATAGDTLTLRLSEIGGTQAWRETGRAAI